jgi:uncharacterized protein (TIGR04141 family)
MPRKPRLQKLTIFLLKDGIAPEEALRDADAATGHRVPTISPERDVLFVASNPPHRPSWARYVAPHTGADLSDLLTASASALLLIEAAERLFAVTFGQGRHLLDLESYEQDFGLKVVLNTVAPDQLKSVDARRSKRRRCTRAETLAATHRSPPSASM